MIEISHPIRAGIWMLGAVASFSAMAVAGREISVEMNTFELMMYRSAIGFLVILLVISRSKRGFSQIRTTNMGLQFKRNIFHFAGQNLWFYGIAVLPFSQLVSLEFTNPIWVAILAPFFLGEVMTKIKIFAAIIGFLGVLIVAQPGVQPFELGHAAGLGAALFFALNVIFTKQISRLETVLCVIFWMTLIQFGFALILSLPNGIPVPSGTGAIWVVVVAICGLTAHFCLTTALSLAPATIVAPMDFVRLPVVTILGMVLYGEELTRAVMIGASVIIIGNLINIRAEQLKQKRKSAA